MRGLRARFTAALPLLLFPLAGLATAQVSLIPEGAVVTLAPAGVTFQNAQSTKITLSTTLDGVPVTGSVELVAPTLPAGARVLGDVLLIPSIVQFRIRQTWPQGVTGRVTVADTGDSGGFQSCSTSSNDGVCNVERLKLDNFDPRRAFLEMTLNVGSSRSFGPGDIKVLFRWTVGSASPACPVVSYDHTEWLQVVQDRGNSIPLVQGKPTAVRLFMKHDNPASSIAVSGIKASVKGFRSGAELAGVPQNLGLTAFDANSKVDRVDWPMFNSLNLRLPDNWIDEEGPLELRFELTVPECGNRPTKINVTESNKFQKARTSRDQPFRVFWIPFCYEPPGVSKTCPDESIVPQYDFLMRKMYPIKPDQVRFRKLQVPPPEPWKTVMGTIDGVQDIFQIPSAFLVYLNKMFAGINDSYYDHIVGVFPPIERALDGMGHLPGRNVILIQHKGGADRPLRDVLNNIHYDANTLAHEVGHNLGQHHTNDKVCTERGRGSGDRDAGTDWPYSTADIQEPGFDVEAARVIFPTYGDLMSYCSILGVPEWLSPHIYQGMLSSGLDAALTKRSVPSARQAEGAVQAIVSGWVRSDGSAGALDPVYQLPLPGSPQPSVDGGSHCIQYSGSAGPISKHCFNLTFLDPNFGQPLSTEYFAFRAPIPDGTTRVALLAGAIELASRTASSAAPVLSITSPKTGDRWEGGSRTISWSGASDDGSPLTYTLWYSPDGGGLWLPLATDITRNTFTFDPSQIEGGSNVVFRVIGTSGLSTATTETGPITVVQTPAIELGANTVDFGGGTVDGFVDQTLMVKNTGSGALSLTEFTFDPQIFRVISAAAPVVIAAGGQQELTIRWNVAASGELNATLRIASTDPAHPLTEVALRGTGFTEAVPNIAVTPAALDFGTVNAGQSAELTVTVTNNGSGKLEISALKTDNPSFTISPAAPVTVDRLTPATFTVRFAPSAAGAVSGKLTITSNDPARGTFTVNLAGTGAASAGGGGNTLKISPLTARGWPNERNINNPPPNAVDGNTDTFTWTTNPNNIAAPSYFGVDFGSAKTVSRIRLFKDNDGGGGTLSDFFKNLTIEYTTTSASTPLPDRTWTRVTGLANGFNGAELLTAVAVNSDGTVTRDSHNSLLNGWASLTFNAVSATGVRIGFSNVTNPTFFNHYKVHEFEAYGPGTGGGSGGATGGTSVVQNGGGEAVPVRGCTVPASIPGWTSDGRVGICSYNAGGGYPGPADPGPPNRGENFFFGGGSAASSMNQMISLASNAAQIDAGTLPYTLSAYLGGYAGDQDAAKVTLQFLNQGGAAVGSAVTLGPVTPADRASVTGLFLRTAANNVPAGARSARVTVDFTRGNGDSNDGYADEISLVLGTGGGTAPALQFSADGIDVGGRVNFLSVTVRTTSSVTLTVKNPGNAAVTVNSVTSSNPVFSADPQSFTIDPAGTKPFTIRFAPTAEGSQQGVLTLNLAGGGTAVLNLTGTGVAATGGGGGTTTTGTIAGIEYRNGGLSNGTWIDGGQFWDTLPTGSNILGVSQPDASAPLLNNPNTKAVSIPAGTYFTYMNPAIRGEQVRVTVKWADGRPDDVAVFAVGSSTVATQWTRVTGSTVLSLASTGLANLDKVGSAAGPDRSPDQVLQLSVGGAGGGATTSGTLQTDDGTIEVATGFTQGGIQGYFVNRLTPASYPATLRKVLIQFPASGAPLNGLPLGSAIQVVSATTTGRGDQLSNVTLARTNATVTSFGGYVEYDVPALTLASSGDFLVGFTVMNPQGVFPAAVDASSTSAQRSYVGTDGTTFFLYDTLPGIRPGNFAIRAKVDYATGGGGSGAAALQPLKLTPSSLSFLPSEVGTTKIVRVDNPNTQSVVINKITPSDPNFANAATLPKPIGAGSFEFIQIRYAPGGAGTHAGTFTIETDPASAGAQFSVSGASNAGGGAGGGTSTKAAINSIAAWPNARTADNVPANAIDGNLSTFTWTTPAFNSVAPSYLGVSFAASASISRLRLYKDNDSGGAGPVAKNLTIEYTTSPASTPLSQRTWIPVTGLTNGFQGTELMIATAVNSNGTVSADNHDSAKNGWASLSFNAVSATGIRVGFSNVTSLAQNHYRVYEFEVYGGGTTGVGATGTVTVTPSTVARGGQVTVSWNGVSTDLRDNWIGLYAETAPTDSGNLLRPTWDWVSTASGSRTFTVPSTPGRYVFWYFLDGGYARPAVKSNVLTVQ